MLPQEFIQRMEQLLGDEYPAFRESYENTQYQALRVNPLRTSAGAFLEQAPFRLHPVAWEPNGFYYADPDTPGRHPYHEAGVY